MVFNRIVDIFYDVKSKASFANTQINFPSSDSFKAYVGLNWGTCCHYHHVVSVDVSGSMNG